MVEQIKGQLVDFNQDQIFLEVGPMVLSFLASEALLNNLPEKGEFVKIVTYLQIKENGWILFGFSSRQERDFFKTLLRVPGVGPKAALKILSIAPLERLKQALAENDETLFLKTPGVGQKLAQKIVLELAGQFKDFRSTSGSQGADQDEQAVEVLESLGYSAQEARRTLAKLGPEVKGLEKRVKAALRLLAR
jgi:Holliday junction DNA helicase RuvA